MKSLCLILVLAISATPACSHFTARARQDRAYARYFKKFRTDRDRRLARLRHNVSKIPSPRAAPPEPRETTQMLEGPQAVPSDPGEQ
jgi:hypothetical protein